MTTLPHDTRIHDLLAVPAEQYDLAWLQESLQVAVELELSTIPPYLCGYWSCQDSSSTAAQIILSVVLQEMLHMGLAANRFGEIYNGALLVQVSGNWQYAGAPVPFPATYPVAPVPEGGWPDPPSNVANLLQQFDAAYSSIIDSLQAAGENGSQSDLGKAIGEMFSLSGPAVQLMQIPLPGGGGNYGPDFLYTPSA